MKKSWTDHLPPVLFHLLRQVKCWLFGAAYLLFARWPVRKNKIVFDNYMGRGFGCNPKYAAQKLIERGTDGYDLVWVVGRGHMDQSQVPPSFRIVRYGSLASLWEYATAGVWVSNYHKIAYLSWGLRKREGQRFVQMWHGSLGIKKIERDVPELMQDRRWAKLAARSSRMTDYWISNSAFETNIYKTAFWGVEDRAVRLYGHPRNDIFFDAGAMDRAYRKVAGTYGLEGKRLLLYAPTFREDYRTDCYALDYPAVLEHMRRRFGGDWAALVRLHPRIARLTEEIIPARPDVADATEYPDIQELLAAADCLVTDYSSCMFDYMLARRPVLLFATDIGAYNTERGFYYPLEQTPFPIATDPAQLLSSIDGFDQRSYGEKVDAFLRGKGCMEDGHAGERVAELIAGLVRGDGRDVRD